MNLNKSILIFPTGSRRSLFLLLIFFSSLVAEGQVLKDSESLEIVKKTVDHIYNMRFQEASEISAGIDTKYPGHPVHLLLNGLIIYWREYPLLSDSKFTSEFEKLMFGCIEECEKPGNEDDAEFLLTNLCARGSLLGFYAGADLHSKAFSLGRSTYRLLRKSFRYQEEFPDFNFFTGLYNYYREAYPEAHPLYKPVFSLFPSGNKQMGLEDLQKAFNGSIFLKAEAATFLSSINKFFENDYEKSNHYSEVIFNYYPGNIVYLLNCIEDQLLTKQYDEAEELLAHRLTRTENVYFQAQLTVLNGILSEKKYNDSDKAEKLYLQGIETLSEFSSYGKQYMAFANYGLSRISASRNDNHYQRVYRRRANDLTDFRNVNFD